MLQNLTIVDLAVVKSLNLNLKKGMSVLTGETGAGKSILLTALGLALGDRADSGYIRPECQRAEINLEFDLSDAPSAKQWLKEHELDNEHLCLIRRVVNRDGPSRAYINNSPVTLQFLQVLSEKLVEIHGQHAHLTLLHADEQRRLLDEFGKHQALVGKVNAVYYQWQQMNKELSTLIQAGKDQDEREELLRYQIAELEQLDLEHFDFVALSEEHQKQANLGLILNSGQQQLDILYDNEEQSISQMLGYSLTELNDLAQITPEMNEIIAMLDEAQIQIQEAAQQLRRYLDAQEVDPQRLTWLEDQIGTIQALSRKHHVPVEQLPEHAAQLQQELDGFTQNAQRIEELTQSVSQLEGEYHHLAEQLSIQRQACALTLQKEISSMIRELGMPHGEFIVAVCPAGGSAPSLNGRDKIEFLVSANPGLPAKPLAKVASGGELSRLSLAIQVATSNDKTTPTMIFDEVDSGIGGAIAEIVGKRLRSLGQNRQVLCVTHLPQVAAQAHQHLYVEKNNLANMTSSTVKTLSYEERIEEIARMLGGIEMTDQTLAHAKEMLTTGNPAL